MYQITHLFTHLRKFVPKIVLPLFKNRNKRYHMREGVLISGATQVLMKRWNSFLGAYTRVGEIRYPIGL